MTYITQLLGTTEKRNPSRWVPVLTGRAISIPVLEMARTTTILPLAIGVVAQNLVLEPNSSTRDRRGLRM